MNITRSQAAALLFAALMGASTGCTRDVDYLSAERCEYNMLVTALEAFQIDTGRYPTRDEGLQALVRDPGVAGWAGPYIRQQDRSILAKFSYAADSDGVYTLERRVDPMKGSLHYDTKSGQTLSVLPALYTPKNHDRQDHQ